MQDQTWDCYESLQPAGSEMQWQLLGRNGSNKFVKAACEQDQNGIWVKSDENVGGENTSVTLKWLLLFKSGKCFRVCFKMIYLSSEGSALERGGHTASKMFHFFAQISVSSQVSFAANETFVWPMWLFFFCLSSIVTAKTPPSFCLPSELEVGDWDVPPPCVHLK